MAATNPDSLQLRRRLESLPQELYDQIYQITFTAEPGVRQLGSIVKNFKEQTPGLDPRPKLLSIDRHSRELYAQRYYGEGAIFVCYDGPTLFAWLEALPIRHRSLLRDVRCVLIRGTLPEASSVRGAYYIQQLLWFMKTYHRNLTGFDATVIDAGEESQITSDLPGYELQQPAYQRPNLTRA